MVSAKLDRVVNVYTSEEVGVNLYQMSALDLKLVAGKTFSVLAFLLFVS